MTNLVDTSNETINAEFDAAEREIGNAEQEQAEQAQQAAEENDAQAAMDEAQRQAEIVMATQMIATSLRFSIGSFVGVTVDDSHYEQAAESYAILIIKYFPGGIFALFDRYKEEIAGVTATFVLIRAVSHAKVKAEEEADAERKAKVKTKPESNTTAHEQGESTNG